MPDFINVIFHIFVLATTNHSLGFQTAFGMIEDALLDGQELAGMCCFIDNDSFLRFDKLDIICR